METSSGTRKRIGRPPKTTFVQQPEVDLVTLPKSIPRADNELPSIASTSGKLSAAESIVKMERIVHSNDKKEADSTASDLILGNICNAGSSNECRRSSRKKTIKFDVRDLLNKNRKPHKIQIEARIDSNAPGKGRSSLAADSLVTADVGSTKTSGKQDLTSKQKTFIEKSAIFRRFSLSEHQNKSISQISHSSMMRSDDAMNMLLVSMSGNDPNAPAAPESSTKGAHPRRLSRTQEMFNASMMKSKQNSSLIIAQMESCSSNSTLANKLEKKSIISQKKAHIEQIIDASLNMENKLTARPQIPKRRGRPPKNKLIDKLPSKADQNNMLLGNKKGVQKEQENIKLSINDMLEKKKGLDESTISYTCSKSFQAVSEDIPQTSTTAAKLSFTEENLDVAFAKRDQQDTILEISSSNSESNKYDANLTSDAKSTVAVDINESKQRNFAAVSFLQTSTHTDNDSDNILAPDFVVAAVEEITDTQVTDDASGAEIGVMKLNELLNQNKGTANESLRELFNKNKRSSSESETNSERSNKPYKKGDKLRVNLKRIYLSKTPNISAAAASANKTDLKRNSKKRNTGKNINRIPKRKTLDKKRAELIVSSSTINKKQSANLLEENNTASAKTGENSSKDSSWYEKHNAEVTGENSAAAQDQHNSNNSSTINKTDASLDEPFKNVDYSQLNAEKKTLAPVEAGESNEDGDDVQSTKLNVHDEVSEQSSTSSALAVDVITKPNQSNVRSGITLPLKKHVSKMQQFALKSDETKTIEITDSSNSSPPICNTIQNVDADVDTSVNTCENIDETASQNVCAETVEHIANSNNTVLPDVPLKGNAFDNSDTFVASITQNVKKTTRRNERLSRRGGPIVAKTLEETFAAIAAVSSQQVLALAALENNNAYSTTDNEIVAAEQPTFTPLDQPECHNEVQNETHSIKSIINIVENEQEISVENKFAKDACLAVEQTSEVKITSAGLSEPTSEDIVVAKAANEAVATSNEACSKTNMTESSETHYESEPTNKSIDTSISLAFTACSSVCSSSSRDSIGTENYSNSIKISPEQKSDDRILNITQVTHAKFDKSDSMDSIDIQKKYFSSENIATAINMNRNPRQPPKKRLSKIQTKLEAVDSLVSRSSEDICGELNTKNMETKVIGEKNPQKYKRMKVKLLKLRRSSEPTCVGLYKELTPTEKIKEKSNLINETIGKPEKRVPAKTNDKKKAVQKCENDKQEKKLSTKTNEKKKPVQKLENNRPEKTLSAKANEKKKPVQKRCKDAVGVKLRNEVDAKKAKKKRQQKLKAALKKVSLNDSNVCTLKKKSVAKNSTTASNSSQKGANIAQSSKVEENTPIVKAKKTLQDFGASDASRQLRKQEEPAAAEELDPLKDIEKFIEDGVNLLKRGYKATDGDVDANLGCAKDAGTEKKTSLEEQKSEKEVLTQDGGDDCNTKIVSDHYLKDESYGKYMSITFETPADTPINTPTATPPSKSPIPEETAEETSLRRSHRIKQITRTPKALVGRGLVRDKERISMKDDVETKSHYSLDDHLTDLAEVEAKNAKFLKDMEERLSNFQVIKENDYKCERIVSREARKMLCDCFLTFEEQERGELACGDDCLNRLLMIECGPDCKVKSRCTNKRFQKFLCAPCRVFRTQKKGFGIMADIEILSGEFIMEYVGEVIDDEEFERRRTLYSKEKNRHYYFMALRSDAIIDATIKGNISRFINHSCDPNAETQKWTVNGELRIGFFSRKSILPGEEITFDYQYQRYGREAQRCYCESANCRGWIGAEPNPGEGEQLQANTDEDNLASGLLDDDDDDTDDSGADAEGGQKKVNIAATKTKLIPMNDGKMRVHEKMDAIKERRRKVGSGDEHKRNGDEDSKVKLKTLFNKVTGKVAAKKKKHRQIYHVKKERKRNTQLDGMSPTKARYQEDPDIEDEVHFLSRCGLKNQSDTLRLSRLMVRAKLVQTRLDLLLILRKGELPCRRLFLDYHGLRLLHGWMSEDGGDFNTRMALLQTLECLPIPNKTVLTDSKVYQMVANWCGKNNCTGTLTIGAFSSSDESSKESSSSNNLQQVSALTEPEPTELNKLATKLISNWSSLPEIFRIPKRERIEQMKEHEREADRQYAAAVVEQEKEKTVNVERYGRDRFGRNPSSRFSKPNSCKDSRNISTVIGFTSDTRKRTNTLALGSAKNLSKELRRELFAAKVAREEAEKRLAEEKRDFETKCRFFGLDSKRTRAQDIPFFVDPINGQWFSIENKPISTPPSYAHMPVTRSTDPADYNIPAAAAALPKHWKYAITTEGNLFYYHVQLRIPQWEPPTPVQIHACEVQLGLVKPVNSESEEADQTEEEDSDSDDIDLIKTMDAKQLKQYIEKQIETRRQQRYTRLVDARPISPRREEDRVYNQLEVRKYKENKEKIRRRKDEIRKRRAQIMRQADGRLDDNLAAMASSSSLVHQSRNYQGLGALPIQDYLLSSDEENISAECNHNPLLQKIVQGDKIVDELDALTTQRSLKRALPLTSEHHVVSAAASSNTSACHGTSARFGANSSSGSGTGVSNSFSADKLSEYKRRKLDKRDKTKSRSKESEMKYRSIREKFRHDIAGIIVTHLKPYRKDTCLIGRIQSDEDFNHLARKLTHFVMLKELKYCESVGQTLIVTESVKNKSREFIKKYMAKYRDVYEKPKNDPVFKDIPIVF